MNDKCKKLEPLIINAAFGDGSLLEKTKVRFHLHNCGECKGLYNEYKSASAAIHKLPVIDCPDEIIKKVEKRIGKTDFTAPSFILDIATIFARINYKTFAASFLIIICFTVGVFLLRDKRENSGQQYSSEEIKQASHQAQQALALVGKILNSTQSKLNDEVISKHIAKPLGKSITVINDLFETGGKNESN
jgi:hypothetical protein